MFKYANILKYVFLFALFISASFLNAQSKDIEVPNVFTPNGDNVNDFFIVDGLTNQWDMHIYDRWGNLVFVTDRAEDIGWDGHNILGIEAINGVYFYILEQNSSNQSYTGSVSLFR
jgi:gliding motility-associated-like protein